MTPLADIAALETHLGQTFTTPAEQDQANQALELASGAVRAYCGWDISRQQQVIELYGEGSCVLTVPTLLLWGVASLTIDGIDQVMGDGTIVVTLKGQLYRSAGWPRFSVIQADCDHGYDVIPDYIRLAVLDLSSRHLQNPEGLVSATVGEVSRTWSNSSSTTLSTLHQNLLDRYRVF